MIASTTTLNYDYESGLANNTYQSSATNSFNYNGLDARVGKVDSAGTSTYRRDGVSATAPVLADGSATFTRGVSERRSSTSKFYGADRMGTNALETNSSQSVTATKTYDAFGMQLSTTGTSASPFGYAGGWGYQEDNDSGLKILGHRYYDASTGRFITRDPAKDGRNWYGYCYNEPTSAIDEDGLGVILTTQAGILILNGFTRHGINRAVGGGTGHAESEKGLVRARITTHLPIL